MLHERLLKIDFMVGLCEPTKSLNAKTGKKVD